MKKELEDLKARDESKKKQFDMLYAVIEDCLGVNVHAAYDDVEIRRAKARRMERQRLDAECHTLISTAETVNAEDIEAHDAEAELNAEENPVAPDLLFTLFGEPKPLIYTREEILKRIEIARRRLEAKKVKVAEIVDDKEDDEDEEDDDFKDIDDYHYDGDDDDDDNNDDNDQGGAGGALIVRPTCVDNIDDYLDDERNEEHEAQRQGESTSGSKQAAIHQVPSKTPKVIYLTHDVEEGELVENWSISDMLDALGLRDENLQFDIEDEIPEGSDEDYVFKHVEDANNFDDVVVEDDSLDSDNDVPPHYEGLDDDFSTFSELFRIHNEDDLRRKVAEKLTTEGPPKVLTKEELRKERKRWFRKPVVEERKFK
ncbi:FK506-binding protein 3-like [Helianthus annuus]|uniref:FK506-binding protein 3-like n=1 Tax=Helianthus annuus TaxID=4232 RepID=UPI000B8FA53E|nr:FK506-binding protein 3-like [Helianthus annuus]